MKHPENYFYIEQNHKAVKITLGLNRNELSYTQHLETIYESSSESDNSYIKRVLSEASDRDMKKIKKFKKMKQ